MPRETLVGFCGLPSRVLIQPDTASTSTAGISIGAIVGEGFTYFRSQRVLASCPWCKQQMTRIVLLVTSYLILYLLPNLDLFTNGTSDIYPIRPECSNQNASSTLDFKAEDSGVFELMSIMLSSHSMLPFLSHLASDWHLFYLTDHDQLTTYVIFGGTNCEGKCQMCIYVCKSVETEG